MISIQSLTDNLLPNLYFKNVTLNSKFKDPVTNDKNAGYYNPDDKYVDKILPTPTATISDVAQANLTLSMKFVKNANFESTAMKLIETAGLDELIKIYVHQVTNPADYEALLSDKSQATSDKAVAWSWLSGESSKRLYSLEDMTGWPTSTAKQIGNTKASMLPEQMLDDGTVIMEVVLETSFTFMKDSNFLAYVAVPVIEHEELEEKLIGKISADILILNGTFQNEGMLFKIAPYAAGADVGALAKYGKPGDVWGGSAHYNDGAWMVGEKHIESPHPRLDYQIVPVTKFVDNRVIEKVKKNIINVTKIFEKINSLTTRYTNSAVNLLDFESYRKQSFISEIFLSQDADMNVQGAFVIDKENLIKYSSAFPFLFDNIKSASATSSSSLLDDERAKLLGLAPLIRLNIFENGQLIGTLDKNSKELEIFPKAKVSTSGGKKPISSGSKILSNLIKLKITKNDFKIQGDAGDGALEDFSFKSFKLKEGKVNYKVEAEYQDPTIQYVKQILSPLNTALKMVNYVLTKVQGQRPSADGTVVAGFDPFTQRINKQFIEEFSSSTIIDGENDKNPGVIKAVKTLADDTSLYIFFYNPEITREEFRNYLYDSANLNSATLDSLLVLQQYLVDLETNIRSILSNVGSKSLKSDTGTANAYGKEKNQGDVNSPRAKPVIKASSEGSLQTYNYGYDFTGFIQRNEENMTVIQAAAYKVACQELLKQLIRPGYGLEVSLKTSFQVKGFSKPMTVNQYAFSYLNIPAKAIKSCVILPATVVDMDGSAVNIENVFTNILKLKHEIYNNNTVGHEVLSDLQGKNHKNLVRKDLNSILGNMFGTSLNDAASNTRGSQSEGDDILVDMGGSLDDGFNTLQAMPNDLSFLKPANSINPNNFILLGILNKLLLSSKNTFKIKMTEPGFSPVPEDDAGGGGSEIFTQASKAPLQVKSLSLIDGKLGPFKDFAKSNQSYIKKGIINPLFLCYYWFIHQNLVRVEYLNEFKTVNDNVSLKNNDNPYEANKTTLVKTRNMQSPMWHRLTLDKINSLELGNKILCRLVRYNLGSYIDKQLVEALNLPLLNNYFILQNNVEPTEAQTVLTLL